ncbi:MAG: DUF4382 domain-containing protein [Cryomorphaceae bacterium]|nr:DUF4382 domain-containing protein [Cryomorphaceae bacterium]
MMKRPIKLFSTIVALSTAVFFTSCNEDDNGNGDGSGSAELNIKLTDNPGDFDEVNVHILGVEIIRPGGPVQLTTQTGIYNLLDFSGDVDTLIAGDVIDAGRINQIRLILGDSNSVVIDGVEHPLTTPSAQQSGLKLNVQEDLVAGVAYEWVLDFDAARSIVITGNNQYILKPVIRVITEGISGSIAGTFDPVGAAGAAYAIAAGDTFGAIADSTGAFLIKNLEAGTYDVLLQPAAGFNDTIISPVDVLVGQRTDMGTISF